MMQSRLAQYAVARHSLHESILDCVGKTPIVKLQKLSPKEGVNVWLKLESENPGGSLKDRLAYGVIEWAEKHGHLKPGQVSRDERDAINDNTLVLNPTPDSCI
jgi:threonine dehydratase